MDKQTTLINAIVDNGVVISKSQARRAISIGIVKLDETTVTDMDSQIPPGTHILTVGKHIISLEE